VADSSGALSLSLDNTRIYDGYFTRGSVSLVGASGIAPVTVSFASENQSAKSLSTFGAKSASPSVEAKAVTPHKR